MQYSLYLLIYVSASSNKGRGRMDGFLHQSSALRLDQVMNEDVLHDLEEGCNLGRFDSGVTNPERLVQGMSTWRELGIPSTRV